MIAQCQITSETVGFYRRHAELQITHEVCQLHTSSDYSVMLGLDYEILSRFFDPYDVSQILVDGKQLYYDRLHRFPD